MPEWNLDTGEMSASPHMIMKAPNPLRVSVDSKQPIPDNPSLSGDNGVAMPGPMKDGDEVGFDAVGRDMRGVKGYAGSDSMPFADQTHDGLDHSAPSNDQGVMREGFGRGTDGDSREEQEPRTNQDFGVASDSGNLGLGDMALNMHLYGTMPSNTDAVRTADIVGVFDAVGRGGSGGGRDGGAVELAGPAMAGIPVAHGSGTIGASGVGISYDAPTGDRDNDGY